MPSAEKVERRTFLFHWVFHNTEAFLRNFVFFLIYLLFIQDFDIFDIWT